MNATWRYIGGLLLCWTTAHALQIKLSNATIALGSDRSCCGSSAQAMCRCDAVCRIYGDCCLDYALVHAEAGYEEAAVSEAASNCSEASGPTPAPPNSTLCPPWETADAGPPPGPAVQAYLCQLRALWRPVILRRSSTRRTTLAPGSERYLLLRDCMEGAPAEDIEACLRDSPLAEIGDLGDLVSLLPVTASDGLHYANHHCARCHGFAGEGLAFWQLELTCLPPDLDAAIALGEDISAVVGNCSVEKVKAPRRFPWPASEPRTLPMGAHVPPGCPDSLEPAETVLACRAYSSPSGGRYPNPHCRPCPIIPPVGERHRPGPGGIATVDQLPISVLFDFSPDRGASVSQPGRPSASVLADCSGRGHGWAFDLSTARCREFRCPPGQAVGEEAGAAGCVPVRDGDVRPGLCTNRSELAGTAGRFWGSVSLASATPLRDSDWRLVEDQLQGGLGADDIQISGVEEAGPNQSPDALWNNSSPLSVSYEVEFAWYEDRLATVEDSERAIGELVGDQLSLNLTASESALSISISAAKVRNFREAALRDECAMRGQTVAQLGPGNVTRLTVNGTSLVRIRLGNGTAVTCPSAETHQEMAVDSGRGGIIRRSAYLCRTKLRCPVIVLNASEYVVVSSRQGGLEPGPGLEIAGQRNVSSQDLIWMTGGRVAVCGSDRSGTDRESSLERAELIVSWAGTSVSELFLLLALLNYCAFPELRRSLPGRNMIGFLLAQLGLQGVFLTCAGTPLHAHVREWPVPCLLCAVLIHYLFLAVFAWSSVVSYHFARTFGVWRPCLPGKKEAGSSGPGFGSGPRPRHGASGRRAFLRYSAFGWGCPALLVVASCALHFSAELGGREGGVYGRATCLLDGGRWVLLLLLALPASCLVCLNAVCFVVTVLGIRGAQREASFAQRERSRQETVQMELLLCIKIFVAMGLLWIVLFIVGHFEAKGLSFLVSLDFTLQGPLIFFAFAFTQRVRDMWRRKLSSATKRRKRGGRCLARCCPRLAAADCACATESATNESAAGDQRRTALHMHSTQTEHDSVTDLCTFKNPLYDITEANVNCADSSP